MDVQNVQCLKCSAPLKFSGDDRQQMVCEYCGSTFEVSVLEEYYRAKEAEDTMESHWDSGKTAEWAGEEAQGMAVYSCPSCGAEIIGDKTMGATQCLYCGNPTVIPSQFAGGLRPDLVLPFRVTKEMAVEALKKHCKGKKLLPDTFIQENHLEEIKGLYVPAWLFDCESDGDITYNGERVSTWSDSKFRYTRTDHFMIRRQGSLSFHHIPVDGSSKMDNTLMESIEPFDTSDAVDFSTAYLSGYFADKYDVDADASKPRADERVKGSTCDVFRGTVSGYAAVHPTVTKIQVKEGAVRYALLPVWILNTKYQDKLYTFAMNGQTGRFVGNLPLDRGKMWKWYFGLTGSVAALVFVVDLLLRAGGVL